MYRVVVFLLSTSWLEWLLRVLELRDNRVNHIYLDSVSLAVIGLFKYQNHNNKGLFPTVPVLSPQSTPGVRAYPSENCAEHEGSYQGEVGWHCYLTSKVKFGVRSSILSN